MVLSRSQVPSRLHRIASALLLPVAFSAPSVVAQRGATPGGGSSNPIGNIHFGGTDHSSRGTPQRIISGQVTDKDGKPAKGALVYCKDLQKASIRTLIADDQGAYRFSYLLLADDFEIWAVNGKIQSLVRPVSSFITTESVTIPLKLDRDVPPPSPAAAKRAAAPATTGQNRPPQ